METRWPRDGGRVNRPPSCYPRAMKKLTAAMADPDQAAALAGVVFDFAVTQPVERFIDSARVLAHLDAALAPAHVQRWLEEHARPAFERESARARARGDSIGDWLPPRAVEALRQVAATPLAPNRAWLEGFVRQDAVQHLLRSIVQETLERFLAALKGGGGVGDAPPSSVSGLVGAMGRSAFGVANSLSKGILGGLGAQVEQQLKQSASAFINGSMSVMLDRVVAIMLAPEAQQRGARLAAATLEQVLGAKTAALYEHAARLPQDALWRAAADVLAHNLARPEVRAAVLEEVEAALRAEGTRPVAALLADAGALDAAREDFVRVATPLIGDLARHPAFGAWLKAI